MMITENNMIYGKITNKYIYHFKTLTSLVRLSHGMQPPYSMTILLGFILRNIF